MRTEETFLPHPGIPDYQRSTPRALLIPLDGLPVPRPPQNTFVAEAYTVCARGGIDLFAEEATVQRFEKSLLEETRKARCHIAVYLFMPDRCYAVLMGDTPPQNLRHAVSAFRKSGGYWLSGVHRIATWKQNGSQGEADPMVEIKMHIHALLNLPVAGGIVDNWRDYRYKGSTLFNLDTLM